jgi:hypothetical protein
LHSLDTPALDISDNYRPPGLLSWHFETSLKARVEN